MRQLSAFINKECMELIRTGKFFILMLLFILFGVMNPAIAKLPPLAHGSDVRKSFGVRINSDRS